MACQEICNFEWGLKQFEQKVCSPGCTICTGYSSWDQQKLTLLSNCPYIYPNLD